MNNEPVAWMETYKGEPNNLDWNKSNLNYGNEFYDVIPLYTHSAKCSKCNDTEWVCENHPDQEAHKCIYCEGAGKPCECTHPAKTLTDDAKYNATVKWDSKTTHHANVSLDIPLHYNEPKTLTDEEIDKTITDCGYEIEETVMGKFVDIEGINMYNSLCGFARAILRKAQE